MYKFDNKYSSTSFGIHTIFSHILVVQRKRSCCESDVDFPVFRLSLTGKISLFSHDHLSLYMCSLSVPTQCDFPTRYPNRISHIKATIMDLGRQNGVARACMTNVRFMRFVDSTSKFGSDVRTKFTTSGVNTATLGCLL